MIFFGEDSLGNTICEFVVHHHLELKHQDLVDRRRTEGERTMMVTMRKDQSDDEARDRNT